MFAEVMQPRMETFNGGGLGGGAEIKPDIEPDATVLSNEVPFDGGLEAELSKEKGPNEQTAEEDRQNETKLSRFKEWFGVIGMVAVGGAGLCFGIVDSVMPNFNMSEDANFLAYVGGSIYFIAGVGFGVRQYIHQRRARQRIEDMELSI